MAQHGAQLDQDKFCCSVCLDLLKDPVSTACGHSYCMDCIRNHWDVEDHKKIYSCPQCRQTFTPRPVLVKNTMLADLVDELKKAGLQAAPADHRYAGSADVACDVCTGRKLKALKSCLVCLVSYCEEHLQPHHSVAQFKKHKLVEPTKKLEENICSLHDEAKKMFCRTDQQPICYLCSVDEHKGHETVSAAAERTERQKELKVSRQKIQHRIHDCKKVMKVLQQEVKAISRAADKAIQDSDKIFTELIHLMEKTRSDLKQQIRTQQEAEVRRVKELKENLELEIADLRKKDAGLNQLPQTEDPIVFLQKFSSLSQPCDSVELPSIKTRPLQYFEDVTAAVSEVRDKLQDVLSERWPKISRKVIEVDAFLSQQLRTREEFLQYTCKVTLDPNTAHPFMVLSDGNRKVTTVEDYNTLKFLQANRFTHLYQILSKESMTGRCYLEVEWDAVVTIAVAYKNMSRSGASAQCAFGYNDKSWALYCVLHKHEMFRHDDIETRISEDKPSYKVGVFLDHKAGLLSFYSVDETMTLLHGVQTTFTQPLYLGLGLHFSRGDNATVCELI